MNYDLIKAAIAAVIKENGNEEITGNILQQSLLAIIDVLGLGYQYAGIATPSTNPGTPDAKVFYIAQAEGTYSNFNDGVSSPVLDGTAIGLFAFDTQWHNTILDVATKSSLGTYLKIADLAAGIGDSETTAMTQKAVTELLDAVDTELGKKANKVVGGTSGNLPKLTANGDLADSDIPATDVATKQELAVATLPGLAEAVIDTDGAGTEQQFTFRKSGGDGGAYYRKIRGKTIVANNQADLANFYARGATTIAPIENGLAITSASEFCQVSAPVSIKQGRNYIIIFDLNGVGGASGPNTELVLIGNDTVQQRVYFEWVNGRNIVNFTAVADAVDLEFQPWTDTGTFGGNLLNPQITDLTLADAALTPAAFLALYPDGFGGYNPGTLISNDAEAVETTGVNQWDEEWESGDWDVNGQPHADASRIRGKNPIPLFPSTQYYIKCTKNISIRFFDAEGNYIDTGTYNSENFTTPAGAAYGLMYVYSTATYNHDICINLSNPAINGQYFPFWKRTINIGITTRKDTDGNVPFPNGLQSCPVAQDEATKEGGTIRVGTRAYQAGDESDANVITDGTNTNYALATPVPFTWAEPLNLGVKVDENGTERAVAPEGATAPSAPFVADTTYTMSIQRMVQKLATL